MRRGYELAISTATCFGGAQPRFMGVGQVNFLRPVEVGSVLNLESRVVLTYEGSGAEGDEDRCAVEVLAKIINFPPLDSQDPNARPTVQVSNSFVFVYLWPQKPRLGKGVPRVLPVRTSEAQHMLDVMQEVGGLMPVALEGAI